MFRKGTYVHTTTVFDKTSTFKLNFYSKSEDELPAWFSKVEGVVEGVKYFCIFKVCNGVFVVGLERNPYKKSFE